MRNFFAWLLKAYAVVAAFALALFVLIVVVLFWNGLLSRSRVDAAWQGLRGRSKAADRIVETRPADGIAEREQILEKRAQELQKVEELTTTRLALIRAEQETLERKRQEALAATVEAKKVQEENAQIKSDAELAANVPILSRMEA